MNEPTTRGSIQLDVELFERVSNVAFLLGVFGIVQGSFDAGFRLGAVLLVLGIMGMLGGAVLRKVPWQRILERLAILGMMTGLLGMFQSWEINLYENGFYILGISTLMFIIVSHVPAPQTE